MHSLVESPSLGHWEPSVAVLHVDWATFSLPFELLFLGVDT